MVGIYAVYDRKSARVGYTFTSMTDEDAKRSFIIACNSRGNIMAMFPEDYELYLIGLLNEATMEIEGTKEYLDTGRKDNRIYEFLQPNEKTENETNGARTEGTANTGL